MINIKTTERNGKVVALKAVQFADELMLITANGIIIRTGLDQIRPIGRNTQGVRLIKLKEGDKLVAAAKISPEAKEQTDNAAIQQAELPPPEETEAPPEEEPEDEAEAEPEPQPKPKPQKTEPPASPSATPRQAKDKDKKPGKKKRK